MKVVASLIAAASVLVASVVDAKCSTMSTLERFEASQTVVLVVVTAARDAAVPWPYGISKGAVPGKDLTLRVMKSWKGTLQSDDVIYGWTQGRYIEDSYPNTDVGTQILLFSGTSPHEVRSCNAADPNRIQEVSAELDAIVHSPLRRGS